MLLILKRAAIEAALMIKILVSIRCSGLPDPRQHCQYILVELASTHFYLG